MEKGQAVGFDTGQKHVEGVETFSVGDLICVDTQSSHWYIGEFGGRGKTHMTLESCYGPVLTGRGVEFQLIEGPLHIPLTDVRETSPVSDSRLKLFLYSKNPYLHDYHGKVVAIRADTSNHFGVLSREFPDEIELQPYLVQCVNPSRTGLQTAIEEETGIRILKSTIKTHALCRDSQTHALCRDSLEDLLAMFTAMHRNDAPPFASTPDDKAGKQEGGSCVT